MTSKSILNMIKRYLLPVIVCSIAVVLFVTFYPAEDYAGRADSFPRIDYIDANATTKTIYPNELPNDFTTGTRPFSVEFIVYSLSVTLTAKNVPVACDALLFDADNQQIANLTGNTSIVLDASKQDKTYFLKINKSCDQARNFNVDLTK